MTSHQLDVNATRDKILVYLESNDTDDYGVNYYDLPNKIGVSQKHYDACIVDLEDRDYVEYIVEGKIKITSRGIYFINSSSFVDIANKELIKETNLEVDRELQRENWITTTKTSKWAIWLSIFSLGVALGALLVAWFH